MVRIDSLDIQNSILHIAATSTETGVYITGIVITNQEGTEKYTKSYTTAQSIDNSFTKTDIDTIDTDLLFVKFTLSDDTTTTYGVYNKRKLVEGILDIINELCDTCAIPKRVIDFILKYNALNLSLLCQENTKAIKFWGYCNKEKDSICELENTCNCSCCHV